uniref:Ras-GEF domain-containing protein n=1 Tax=Macrostomum lignano TaxID=282301 RepID=A0A1I8JNY1_9PLAT
MIRSESFTDVGDAESPEPVDPWRSRSPAAAKTSEPLTAGNAASSCSKVHSEGVGSTGLVAAKPSIKDDTAEEERKRRIARGCDVAITNTALYEDDGRDYTDPAQLNVLYPAERVDPALAPYLDMSRPAESLLLMTSSMVTSGVYARLVGNSRQQRWSGTFLSYWLGVLAAGQSVALLPGLYCRLQTIVFDEAGELRRFLFFRHNLLRCLVSLTVLSRRTTRERVKLLSVWIEVLFLLRNEFKDLFAYRSVLMALTSSQTREFRRFRCVVDPADKRVIYDLIPLVKFPAHLYTFSFEGHDKQIEDTTMDELSLIPMVKEIFSSETLLKVLMDPAMSEVPTVERFSELCQSLEASMTSMAARAGFTP